MKKGTSNVKSEADDFIYETHRSTQIAGNERLENKFSDTIRADPCPVCSSLFFCEKFLWNFCPFRPPVGNDLVGLFSKPLLVGG